MILARHRKPIIKYRHINFVKEDLVYIHIPKCAGTTVGQYFSLKKTYHSTYKEINKILAIQKIEFKTFALVRNPYARFISLYNYARMQNSHWHDNSLKGVLLGRNHKDYKLLKNATLEECITHLENGLLKHDRHWNQWEPQHSWLTNEQNIITVDKLAKVENINNSLIEISKHYGLPVNSLEILNKSEVTEKLTDILKERVYNYYKRDFQLFDYPR